MGDMGIENNSFKLIWSWWIQHTFMHNSHWRPSFFNAKFTVFLVLRFLSTFDMFFSGHNSTRKHHKTFSCNLFGVHVLLVHILTLLEWDMPYDNTMMLNPSNCYARPPRAVWHRPTGNKASTARTSAPNNLSLPHTSSPGSAIGRLRLAAHVGSAREPRVRINSARIWPRASVRQISVVFNIFRLVHPKAHHGCVVC